MKEQAGRGVGTGIFWAVASISALIPLAHSPTLFGPFTVPKAILLWVGAGIVLGLTGLLVATNHSRRRPGGLPLWLPAVFAVALALMTLTSIDPVLSIWGARNRYLGLATYAAGVILFYGTALSAEPLRTRIFARLIAAGSVPLSALALAQRAGFAYPLDFGRALGERVGSTVGNPNFLGIYLAMTLALALGLATEDERRYRPSWYAVSGLVIAGLIVTNSLGAWAAAAVVIGAWVWRTTAGLPGRTRAIYLSAASISTATLSALLVLRSDVGFSIADRAAVWTAGVRAYATAPLTGSGLETLRSVIPEVQPLSLGSEVYADAHNLFITLAAATGALPVLLFIAILVTWFSAKPRGQELSISSSLKAAAAAYIVGHLFNPESIAPFTLFWAIGGLLVGNAIGAEAKKPATKAGQRARVPAGITLVILGVIATVGLGSVGARIWQAERYIKIATREPELRVALDYAARAQSYWPRHPLYGYLLFDEAAPYIGKDAIVTAAVEEGLDRALAFNPRDADAYYMRGVFHSRLSAGGESTGEVEAALANWEEAVRFNRVKLQANFELAKAYVARGENERAAEHLELLLRLISNNDDHRPEIEGLLRQARSQ